MIRTIKEFLHRNKLFNFYSEFVAPDDLVIDIGANIGNRVWPFLKIGARVVAVEPQIECCQILSKKFKNSNLKIIQKGVGSRSEKLTFFKGSANTLSTFSKNHDDMKKRFKDHEWKEAEEKIEIVTLDSIIDEEARIPKFIKIDVEGFESEVLKGLNHKIPYISFEYNTPECIENLQKCLDVIRSKKIYSGALFNYSVGESMSLALDQWLSFDDFYSLISKDSWKNDFIWSGFGDVYIKNQDSDIS